MRQLAAIVIGFVAACAIAAVKGADLTSALVIGMFYTLPILLGLVLGWWGPAAIALAVVIAMLIAGPVVPRDQQDSVIASWGWLWAWIAIAVVLVVAFTWIEQKVKGRKARK